MMHDLLDHRGMAPAPIPIMDHQRRPRAIGRRLAFVCMALLVGMLAGCKMGKPGTAPLRVTLVVENRGYFDVIVYAVRSPGARGTRLGNVTGNSTQIFRVRETDLQAGGIMTLQVRAIGGHSTWTSPGLQVSTQSVAKLDLVATGSSDYGQSQFYVRQ